MRSQVRLGLAFVVLVMVVGLASAGLQAQTTYPFIAELTQNYTIIKNNHLRMADKMPEEHYSFKPAPEIRSFGEALAHTADLLTRSCRLVMGEPSPADAAAKPTKPKAELIAELKASFARCDAALNALTDAAASDMVKLGQSTRTRSKLGLLIGMTSHANEQYGYMAVYLRLKGIVPPSSETPPR